MELNQETFKEWVFKQPDGRKFDYSDIHDCLGCSFVKEAIGIPDPVFSADQWRIRSGNVYFKCPSWWMPLTNAILTRNGMDEEHFTATDAKAAWLKLFPETTPEIPTPENRTVEHQPQR